MNLTFMVPFKWHIWLRFLWPWKGPFLFTDEQVSANWNLQIQILNPTYQRVHQTHLESFLHLSKCHFHHSCRSLTASLYTKASLSRPSLCSCIHMDVCTCGWRVDAHGVKRRCAEKEERETGAEYLFLSWRWPRCSAETNIL